MILYPAIDLKDGLCVRVLHGDLAAPYQGELHGPHFTSFGWGPRREYLTGLPHFADVEFKGEYPLAALAFADTRFPGDVALRAAVMTPASERVPVRATIRYPASRWGSSHCRPRSAPGRMPVVRASR